MEHLYVIGIDYGTDSVRALLADAESGEEIAVAVCNYSRWGRGLYCDTAKSQFRQHPLDYLEGLEQVLRQVIVLRRRRYAPSPWIRPPARRVWSIAPARRYR